MLTDEEKKRNQFLKSELNRYFNFKKKIHKLAKNYLFEKENITPETLSISNKLTKKGVQIHYTYGFFQQGHGHKVIPFDYLLEKQRRG